MTLLLFILLDICIVETAILLFLLVRWLTARVTVEEDEER